MFRKKLYKSWLCWISFIFGSFFLSSICRLSALLWIHLKSNFTTIIFNVNLIVVIQFFTLPLFLVFLLLGPSLYGIFPYSGLKFYFYEETKSHVPENYKNSVAVKLACGSVAGLLGQTITYPLDVVRRQMQVIICSDSKLVMHNSHVK